MNFREAFRALFRKSSAAGAIISGNDAGQQKRIPRDYEAIVADGYEKCQTVFACVARIAEGAASIPLEVYVDGEEAEDHPLEEILRHPNPFQSGDELREAAFAFYLLSGNSYIERVTSGTGGSPIIEMYVHRPDWMYLTPGKNGTPARYTLKNAGRESVPFDVDELTGQCDILHWHNFNPRSVWFGMPTLATSMPSVMQLNAAQEWNANLLQNDAQPGGAFVYKPGPTDPAVLSDEQIDAITKQMDERMKGPRNARRPLVLGNLQWQSFQLSPVEMDWINSKNSSKQDICQAFKVPGQILGLPDSQTYSNYEEARLSLWQETILPLHRKWCAAMSRWAGALYGEGVEIRADIDDLPALAPVRADLWEKVQSSEFLTVNEKREACGYEEVEGGDVILVSSSKIPLEDVGIEPTISPMDEDGDEEVTDAKPPKKPAVPPKEKP